MLCTRFFVSFTVVYLQSRRLDINISRHNGACSKRIYLLRAQTYSVGTFSSSAFCLIIRHLVLFGFWRTFETSYLSLLMCIRSPPNIHLCFSFLFFLERPARICRHHRLSVFVGFWCRRSHIVLPKETTTKMPIKKFLKENKINGFDARNNTKHKASTIYSGNFGRFRLPKSFHFVSMAFRSRCAKWI